MKHVKCKTDNRVDAFKVLQSVHAIPIDEHMRFRCRHITMNVNTRTAHELYIMVLQQLQDPNREICRNLLDMMKDLLSHRLHIHEDIHELTPKKKSHVCAKIMYCNKGMESIKLSRILHSCTDTIPASFKNKDAPRVLYLRTKSTRSTLLNYHGTMKDAKVNEWMNHTYTCDCHNSNFCDAHHGHVVTGDLNIIENEMLRNLFEKGPTYREEEPINWNKVRNEIKKGLMQCKEEWARLEDTNPIYLDDWICNVMMKVNAKIRKLEAKHSKHHVNQVLTQDGIKKELALLHEKYVMVPTDKASNNISIVCKEFYISAMLKELNVFDDNIDTSNATYEKIDSDPEVVIDKHIKKLKEWKLHLDDKLRCLIICVDLEPPRDLGLRGEL